MIHTDIPYITLHIKITNQHPYIIYLPILSKTYCSDDEAPLISPLIYLVLADRIKAGNKAGHALVIASKTKRHRETIAGTCEAPPAEGWKNITDEW